MTLPASNLAMSQVAAELGISQAGLSLNHAWVRALAGVAASGPVSFANLLSKSGRIDGNFPTTTGAGAFSITMNAPFFNGILNTLQSSLGTGGAVGLFGNTAISWTGPILIINNTTGVSVRVTPQDGGGVTVWVYNAPVPNLLRGSANDSFTFLPTT